MRLSVSNKSNTHCKSLYTRFTAKSRKSLFSFKNGNKADCRFCSLPFLKAFYKRSPWYRDLGEQYAWGIESTASYKIYNLAAKAGLPLEYREIKGDRFFFFEDRVIFPLCDYVDELFYSEGDGRFRVFPFGEEGKEREAVSLDEFMETVLADHGIEEQRFVNQGIMRISRETVLSFHISKKSVDARKKNDVCFVVSIDVYLKNPQDERRLAARLAPNVGAIVAPYVPPAAPRLSGQPQYTYKMALHVMRQVVLSSAFYDAFYASDVVALYQWRLVEE